MSGTLLEHRDDARFIMPRSLADELRGQHALAGARRPGEQHRVAGRDATAEHLVQRFDADRKPLLRLGLGLRDCHDWWERPFWPDDDPREHLNAVVRDA